MLLRPGRPDSLAWTQPVSAGVEPLGFHRMSGHSTPTGRVIQASETVSHSGNEGSPDSSSDIRRKTRPSRSGLGLYSGGPEVILESSSSKSGLKPTFLLGMKADLEKIREIAQRVACSEGLELVDVELKGPASNHLLRVFIDKPEGVNHGDCRLVSEQLGAILEVENPFPGRYVLEVSSPGLDRPLMTAADYQRHQGRRVRITLTDTLDGRRNLEGRLAGFLDGNVRLEVTDKGVIELDPERIARAKLVVDFKR